MNSESRSMELPNQQYIVGIGASAGGLEAVEAFFKHMPINAGLSFVVIQHLSPHYKSLMAELLSKHTQMPVKRIEDGMSIEPNTIYLITPGKNVTVFHSKLLLVEQDHSKNINLPIDLFLRSLAEDAKEKAIGIILSGTGSDGTRGIRAIKEYGGMVMVQDESTAKFDGMPKNAFATGLADFSLAPEKMPAQLLAFVKHPYATLQEKSLVPDDDNDINRIFAILRDKCKIDFTFYKPNTVVRRIERRITINQLRDLQEYLLFLQNNPNEIYTLYQELLIGVTNFFRDEHVFEEIKDKWLEQLDILVQGEELRVWVTACSTGEEAYSIAMLLAEYREETGRYFRIKIFATDVDNTAIEKASNGRYPESVIADIPPKLLSKYFVRREDYFQISQKIREMVVFAQHNLIKDPPFTNIHFLSCRNVLIYLQPIMQKKILELFNFTLVKDGLLLLGTSETIGDMTEFFDVVSLRAKIFRSKGKQKSVGFVNASTTLLNYPPYPGNISRTTTGFAQDDRVLERFIKILSDDILPFTLIVNENMEISHIFGEAKDYLSYPSGKLVTNITKIVKKDLSIPIATGIQKVIKGTSEVVLSNIRLREKETLRTFKLQFKQIPGRRSQENLVAVMIHEKSEPSYLIDPDAQTYDLNQDAKQRILDLEQELQFTRENLQATVEELETSNEELQATNEELLASNEELQSTNEELQSVNEELYTVNAEHQGKIVELTLLNNDLDNLFNSTNIATLFLDENLDIRRFTPKLQVIFHVLETDIGRPFFHLTHSIKNFALIDLVKEVNNKHLTFEQEIQLTNDYWYLMRIIPYAISSKENAGVILTFIDINQLKQTQIQIQKREQEETQRLAKFVKYTHDAVCLIETNGKIVTWNAGAENLYGWSEQEALSMNFTQLIPPEELSKAQQGVEDLLNGNIHTPFRVKRRTKYGKTLDILASACIFHPEDVSRKLIALTERDYVFQHQEERNECISCMQKLATIVWDVVDVAILFDVNGNILAWNKHAEQSYGWHNGEALAKKYLDLIPETDQVAMENYINKLLQGEKIEPIISKRISKQDQILQIKVSATLIGNQSGEVLMFIAHERPL